jgi:hypothetical protein
MAVPFEPTAAWFFDAVRSECERPGRYTAADLLSEAEGVGIFRTQPWLRTLVKDGLLDYPDKHGVPGRQGGRSPGTWPQPQHQLFLALLAQLQQGVMSAGTLSNLPVASWLYIGPEYVPVRQVRRALGTYAHRHGKASKATASRTARRVAEIFAGGPDMSVRSRRVLREEIVRVASAGRLVDERLLSVARKVFSPDDAPRALGPSGARVTPENWLAGIRAIFTAIDRLDSLDEAAFDDTRIAHHSHMAEYVERQPSFSRDRATGALFEPVTLQYLLSNACLNTLTLLGHRTLQREPTQRRFDAKSPPRPLARPGGTAHGGRASACSDKVPRRSGAASSPHTATG